MEAPLIEASPGELQLTGDHGDYLPVKGLKARWRVFCIESAKLWRIGGPIAFQILCQYSTTSVTTVFVGHLGDIELAAFSIALSVVCTFAFGFMVSLLTIVYFINFSLLQFDCVFLSKSSSFFVQCVCVCTRLFEFFLSSFRCVRTWFD